METKAVLIKKYENRRLYDTTNSRYVNLDEVAQMLQRGEDVKVVDAATGEDITRLILTQIIVEDAKTTDSELPHGCAAADGHCVGESRARKAP